MRSRNKIYLKGTATLLALAGMTSLALAAEGDLDTAFGTNGVTITPIETGQKDTARAVKIDSSGRILVAGESDSITGFKLVRYTSSGALDTTFGTNGIFTSFFDDYNNSTTGESAFDLAIDSDGSIVVVGAAYSSSTNFDLGAARVTTNGTLDTSFGGSTGLRAYDIQGSQLDYANAVAINPTNRNIITVGSVGGTTAVFIAVMNQNGDLNTGFDSDGKWSGTYFAGDYPQMLNDVAVHSNAYYYAAGYADHDNNGTYSFFLTRHTSSGRDLTFGSGGYVTADFATNTYNLAYAMAIDANGKIVLAGSTMMSGSASTFALARFNTDGSLDTAFGTGGQVTTAVSSNDDVINGVTIDSNGKIIAVGKAGDEVAIARYNSDGSLDTTFSTDGMAVLNPDSTSNADIAYDVAIDANGNPVIVGITGIVNNNG